MKYIFFLLAIVGQVIFTGGQVLLKKAMTSSRPFRAHFVAAIVCMAAYFFLWLALARHLPLSQLTPFDALGTIFLIAAAHLVLKEHLSPRAKLGIAFILLGITAIAFS